MVVSGDQAVLVVPQLRPDTPPFWVFPGGLVAGDQELGSALVEVLSQRFGLEVEVLHPIFMTPPPSPGLPREVFFLAHTPQTSEELASDVLQPVPLDPYVLVEWNIRPAHLAGLLLVYSSRIGDIPPIQL